MVHARRKAIDASGKSKAGKMNELVLKYATFFHNEETLRDMYKEGKIKDEEYIKERRKVLEPLLEDIKNFCKSNIDKSLPGTPQHTAYEYPLQRWDKLTRFLDYPYATSSNQNAENKIRPFCLGKKNWLFCITELGAQVSAMYYSLVESCKAMGINVQDYLTSLLLRGNLVKDGDTEGWKAMLPGKLETSIGANYRDYLFHNAAADTSRTEPYRLRGKRV